MVVETLGYNVVLNNKERIALLTAKPDDRQIAIQDLSYNILSKYGDGWEGTPEYDSVRAEVVCALYEELLTEIEIVHHKSLPIDNIVEKI